MRRRCTARVGIRRPVEAEKIEQTQRELKQEFSGYSKSRVEGWYRDENTGKEFDDEHIRFEIDAVFDGSKIAFLTAWKRTLECRFKQHEIYFKLSGAVEWF